MVLSVSGKTMNGKEYPLICRNKIWISIQGRFLLFHIKNNIFLRAVNRKPYCFTSLQIIAMTLRLAYGADQSSVKQRPAYHHHITSTSEVKVSWFLILPRQNTRVATSLLSSGHHIWLYIGFVVRWAMLFSLSNLIRLFSKPVIILSTFYSLKLKNNLYYLIYTFLRKCILYVLKSTVKNAMYFLIFFVLVLSKHYFNNQLSL